MHPFAPATLPRNLGRTRLALALAAAFVPLAGQSAPTVTSNADSGAGTLRQAILDANSNCGSDASPIIDFAIPGPSTILLFSPLPAFSCGSAIAYTPTVDGYTQPGSAANTAPNGFNALTPVVLDGSPITFSVCGLQLTDFSYGGTLTVRGLRIQGFSVPGSEAVCDHVRVHGSRIVGNNSGVMAGNNALIGGPGAQDRNVLSGNANHGVRVSYAGPVTIQGNLIGTDDTGTASSPNGIGVYLEGNSGSSVVNNVISGNSGPGVYIDGSSGVSIVTNKIGVGVGGVALGNGAGLDTNTSVLIQSNEIANNASFGVRRVLFGSGTRITQNSIHANGVKNIDLDFIGPLPNDAMDADTGPNNRQNHPDIVSIVPNAGNTDVTYSFNSNPGITFTVEFFSNAAPGTPSGRTFIASRTVTTDGAGNLPSATITDTLIGTHNNLSMTATHSDGSTSEFSPAVGAATAPGVTQSSGTMAFGNVPIGTTSATLSVMFTSSGTAPWQITGIGNPPTCYGGPICYGGAFTCTNTCATFTPYAPGASCGVTATFSPSLLGPQATTIEFCDNAPGTPHSIVLSGNGVPVPTVTLMPSMQDFGNATTGQASAPFTFTVSNPGATPVDIGSVLTSGPFTVASTNCIAAPVPPLGNCTADVTFNPVADGLASGALAVATTSGASVFSSLMGNGQSAPQLSLPSIIDFPTFTLGGAMLRNTLTLRNSGSVPLVLSSLTATGPFGFSHDCPSSLAPGASCAATFTFTSETAGRFEGEFVVVSNAPGGSGRIPILGIAVPRAVPTLQVTPRDIGFGSRAFGTTTSPERITIRNIGGATAVFDSFVVGSDFIVAHDCVTLAPGASCFADVSMRPLSAGRKQSTLFIGSNAEQSPHGVLLFGTGCRSLALTASRLGITQGCGP